LIIDCGGVDGWPIDPIDWRGVWLMGIDDDWPIIIGPSVVLLVVLLTKDD